MPAYMSCQYVYYLRDVLNKHWGKGRDPRTTEVDILYIKTSGLGILSLSVNGFV